MSVVRADNSNLDTINGQEPNASLEYTHPPNADWMVVHLIPAGETWPTSLVLTHSISLDGATFSNFPSGAVTYSGAGVQEIMNVTGVAKSRIRVTTLAGAAGTVRVVVTAGKDNP